MKLIPSICSEKKGNLILIILFKHTAIFVGINAKVMDGPFSHYMS